MGSMPDEYKAEPRRVTNAEIKRDLQRIEGRILKNSTTVDQIATMLPDLVKLSEKTDMLLHLAQEAEDDEIAWSVLRKWLRWDKGTRTFLKAVAGAIIVALCTVAVYSLFNLSPTHFTPPAPTPTPITTPTAVPIPLP